MPGPIRSTARWLASHAFPAAAVAVVAVGAAGGGIGYAVATQHATAAPVAAAPTPSATPGIASSKRTAGRADMLIQRGLRALSAATGQSVASIQAQLAAGKSIDQVAGAKAPTIETEILNGITQLVDRGVARGRISAAQKSSILAMAKTKVDALMAEPGTTLVKDIRQLIQQFQRPGGFPGSAASPSATPAA